MLKLKKVWWEEKKQRQRTTAPMPLGLGPARPPRSPTQGRNTKVLEMLTPSGHTVAPHHDIGTWDSNLGNFGGKKTKQKNGGGGWWHLYIQKTQIIGPKCTC